MKTELKNEAIRLRTEERASFREIQNITGVSKGTLSIWLANYPLTLEELKTRRRRKPYKDRGLESKFYSTVKNKELTRLQKGKIAEAAIIFRLVLNGFNVYNSIFDGDKYDCLVEIPETKRIVKLQIRWAKEYKNGLPLISLKCSNGFKTYRKFTSKEFDFIVGYNLFNDTAYIYSFNEIDHLNSAITTSKDGEEAWNKLLL